MGHMCADLVVVTASRAAATFRTTCTKWHPVLNVARTWVGSSTRASTPKEIPVPRNSQRIKLPLNLLALRLCLTYPQRNQRSSSPSMVTPSLQSCLLADLEEFHPCVGAAGQCLVANLGWWSYEWCHLRHVRQFHLDPTTGREEVSWSLGNFRSARRSEGVSIDGTGYYSSHMFVGGQVGFWCCCHSRTHVTTQFLFDGAVMLCSIVMKRGQAGSLKSCFCAVLIG